MSSRLRKIALPLIIALILGTGLSACSGSHDAPDMTDAQGLAMASMDGMPHEVQTAPATVRAAYQFAAANAEIMQQIPCYCGCGAMGHTSNYACYVAEVGADGAITYDPHALGCSICVDITQDVMRLLKQGQAAPEIRAYVDQTYAKFGPSNMPPAQ